MVPSTSSLFTTDAAFDEAFITDIIQSSHYTRDQKISAIIQYQTRLELWSGEDSTPLPPDTGNTTQILEQTQVDMPVEEKYRLLVDFFAERFGYAPRDVINAIEIPAAPYARVSDALSELDRSSLQKMISGLGSGWTPNFESHHLFVILPEGESAAVDGITVETKFQLSFKSTFIARKVGTFVAHWAIQDGLALYNEVRNMGAPARALFG